MGLKRMAGAGWRVLVAGGFLLLAAGCESTPQTSAPGAPVDQLPWNTPATWENSVIGVPY